LLSDAGRALLDHRLCSHTSRWRSEFSMNRNDVYRVLEHLLAAAVLVLVPSF